MDIERLSKVQIVLLTLLVSFVTSIATGIVTVSLMDQAPPSVEQTVNRVIEHTVQTVVPSQAAATAVTQEKTVVSESDLISQAVQQVSPSIVRIFSSDTANPSFLGLGVVLDASGTIAADIGALGESPDAVAELPDGTHVYAPVTSRDSVDGIAYLTSATTTAEGTTPTWTPVTIAGTHATLGETVVMLAGNTVARIQDGIITSLIPATDTLPQIIDTDIGADSIMPGSPLIDTDGSLVGFSTGVSRNASPSGFVPASVLGSTLPVPSSGQGS